MNSYTLLGIWIIIWYGLYFFDIFSFENFISASLLYLAIILIVQNYALGKLDAEVKDDN